MKNIFFFFIALSFMACQSQESTEQSTVEPTESPETDSHLQLTQAQVTMAGISFDSLRLRPFKKEIHVTGTFDLPPEYRASVSAYFGGYVSGLKLIAGEHVRKGRPLFYLENPDYLKTQQSFLEVKSRLRHLKSSYERQKGLLADQASSEKVTSEAQMEYEVAQTQYESLKKQLQLMGINPSNLNASAIVERIAVRAPISGFVSDIHIAQGPVPESYGYSDVYSQYAHLHLELSVFEKDYPKMKKGLPIRFFLPDSPDKSYQGEVHLPARSIDASSRQGMIHAHISEGTTANFAPGMYVEAYIELEAQQLPSLPRSAVFEEDGKYFVWIKEASPTEETRIKRLEVALTSSTEEYVAIKNAENIPSNALFIVKGGLQLGGEA